MLSIGFSCCARPLAPFPVLFYRHGPRICGCQSLLPVWAVRVFQAQLVFHLKTVVWLRKFEASCSLSVIRRCRSYSGRLAPASCVLRSLSFSNIPHQGLHGCLAVTQSRIDQVQLSDHQVPSFIVHVLVIPKRVVLRYSQLTSEEVSDLWLSSQTCVDHRNQAKIGWALNSDPCCL